jgi:putative GTP pyrophosphokinase
MTTFARLEEISRVYAEHGLKWKDYLSTVAQEVAQILESHGLHASVKMRVKTFESLSEKRSYLSNSSKESDPEIKDLLGLRIVVPFQEDVEQAVLLLHKHYNIGEIERKSEQLTYREFAYDSVHVELPVHEGLVLPPACRPVIEVQVRTILQDAWAEVEHELIYKNHFRFPNSETTRKKLAAVNASLSLADMIFQEIRDSQKEMAAWGRKRFKAMLDKAGEGFGSVLPSVEGPLPQATLPGIEPALAGNRAEIERNLMAALRAHNEKDYRGAIRHYSRVLECNPELPVRSVVFSHRGMAYFMLQQESLALSDFDRAFQCDKSNYRAVNYRAMILRRMGYIEPALECFELSLSIMPQQTEVYFLRGQTLAETGEPEKAAEDLRRALELEPEHQEARALLEQILGSVPVSLPVV